MAAATTMSVTRVRSYSMRGMMCGMDSSDNRRLFRTIGRRVAGKTAMECEKSSLRATYGLIPSRLRSVDTRVQAAVA